MPNNYNNYVANKCERCGAKISCYRAFIHSYEAFGCSYVESLCIKCYESIYGKFQLEEIKTAGIKSEPKS